MNDEERIIKACLSLDEKIDLGQLLQVNYQGQLYKFHIERLVFRHYGENDYVYYGHKKTIETELYRFIFYIAKGNAIWLDQQLMPCPEGTLLLLSPGTQPSVSPAIKGEYKSIIFTFYYKSQSGDYLTLPLSKLLTLMHSNYNKTLPTILPLPSDLQHQLATYYASYYELLDDFNGYTANSIDPGKYYDVVKKFLSIITLIMSSQEQGNQVLPPPIQQALIFIQEHYKEELHIQDIAQHVCLSKPHFQHLFKTHVHMTPLKYQQSLRIHQAKLLLTESNYSCGEIAELIGYNSLYYFSRQFKSYTGISPLAYREKNKLY